MLVWVMDAKGAPGEGGQVGVDRPEVASFSYTKGGHFCSHVGGIRRQEIVVECLVNGMHIPAIHASWRNCAWKAEGSAWFSSGGRQSTEQTSPIFSNSPPLHPPAVFDVACPYNQEARYLAQDSVKDSERSSARIRLGCLVHRVISRTIMVIMRI